MSKTERFHMLRPDQVADAAKKKEKQNLRFRTYLKTHADEAELDSRFAALHAELFSGYDCSACRNCCRLVSACIKAWDIPAIAAHLSMTEGDFKDRFLVQGDFGEWGTKHTPCDFLLENGECMLGDCKPDPLYWQVRTVGIAAQRAVCGRGLPCCARDNRATQG